MIYLHCQACCRGNQPELCGLHHAAASPRMCAAGCWMGAPPQFSIPFHVCVLPRPLQQGGAAASPGGDAGATAAGRAPATSPLQSATWRAGEPVPFCFLAEALEEIGKESGVGGGAGWQQ